MQLLAIVFFGVCVIFVTALTAEPETTCHDIECGPHKVLKCGRSPNCTLTCQRRYLESDCYIENTVCGVNGLKPRCFCDITYLLNESTGQCVAYNQCPCEDPNAVFRLGNYCKNQCRTRICPLYYLWGCFCKTGFCANAIGECVPVSSNTSTTLSSSSTTETPTTTTTGSSSIINTTTPTSSNDTSTPPDDEYDYHAG